MLKKLCLLTLVIISMFGSINIINADEYENIKVRELVKDFNNYLEDGDEGIYTFIDEDNITLKENIDKYFGNILIHYTIKDVSKNEDNSYKVSGIIDVHGNNWNVSGFNVTYYIEEINGDYKIISTSLFEVISPEYISKFVFTILGIVFGSLAIIGLIITVIVLVIVRKKKEVYTGTM